MMRWLLAIALLGPLAAADPREAAERRRETVNARMKALFDTKLPTERKRIVTMLAKAADKDIDYLIRYREAHAAPVFVEVLRTSRKASVRVLAAYGLKMTGGPDAVPALATALRDLDPMVREAVANALGHIGGDAAKAALETQRAAEKEPYVLATVECAIALASSPTKPIGAEGLEGTAGTRRVRWVVAQPGPGNFDRGYGAAVAVPVADRFVYPVQRYKDDYWAGELKSIGSFGNFGTHAGEDRAWFREGCSIYAIADGVVRVAQDAGADLGHVVAIEHKLPDGRFLTSVYAHCAHDLVVAPGDIVKCGRKIATIGLSFSAENGGQGASLHFALGDGPCRRPNGCYVGLPVNCDFGGNETKQVPILRLTYSALRNNSRGWPLTTMVVSGPDGECSLDHPEEPLERELSWIRIDEEDTHGWLSPLAMLPELVEGKKKAK